jgi:hypothetical protein
VALLSKFFGRTASEGAAYAFGVATGPVLAPATESIRQEAWMHYATRALLPGDVAGIVAEDVKLQSWGEAEAARTGLNQERFDALLGEALNAPGIGNLYELWRRGEIDDAGFAHGLRKAKLEPRWDAPLRALHDVLLSPDTLANARQQGFVDVARQHSESALQGVTSDRADILFELSGNPPGPETLQRAYNRSFIDRATFDQGIREGRTKKKYTDLFFELRQPLLTAATAVRLYLKGWWTQAQRDALGAQWGYSSEQMNDMYLAAGRPAAPGQMATATARGIDGPDGRPMDQAQFLKGIKESDIRPEWGQMLWESRFLYPPLFQTVRLLNAGTIDAATAALWLKNSRYPPDVIDAIVAGSSGGTTSATDAHIAKAQTQLWTTTHRSYVANEVTATVARNKLGQAGVSAAAIPTVLGVWDHEKELIRKQLTPAQIKKALAKASRNAATGTAWTRDEALAALISLGYDVTTANDYLDIP